MRTVTFADEKLTATINASVVPVWHNQDAKNELNVEGRFHTVSPQAIPSQQTVQYYPVGAGGQNMQTFFLTPEGRLVHYTEGYWPPEYFAEELAFAQRQFAAARKLEGNQFVSTVRAGLVSNQNQITAELIDLKENLSPYEATLPPAKSPSQQRVYALGLRINAYAMGQAWAGMEIRPLLIQMAQRRLMRGAFI